jgi:hypothetical protein
MCYCDDEMPTLYSESNPTARKQHVCCECGSMIDPGEKYFRSEGLWDGDFLTFKTCGICQNIKNEALAEGVECIAFACLYETVGSDFEYAAL